MVSGSFPRAVWLVAALLAWMPLQIVTAADIVARLDRTQVVEGETVTLVLQTDDPAQSMETDLSALEADFILLDQRTETQMSIVNGQQNALVRLLVTLEPKRSGRLVIPPLEFTGALTQALELEVEPAPELAPGEMPPVFIELSLEPRDGPYYVHSQLSLTVKIFYQQNLTEATINPPSPEQASVRLLDEVPFPAERNGVAYRVLQRRYAIFPERSGTLDIPPMRLTGRLIERPGNRLWQPSVRGRRVTEESEALSVEVLPRPQAFSGDHWLPARQIELTQQVSGGGEVRVGEPVTRTVIVDAIGLEENMIEEPHWPEMADARIYPDQPQGISRDDGQWVKGHREFRYAVVPEKAGELVLPEIRLDWWDTVADQQRTAVLPERRVRVKESEWATPTVADPLASAPSGSSHLAEGGGARAIFWRNAAISFAALWLLTLLAWWRLRRPGATVSAPGRRPELDESDLLSELKTACRNRDTASTRTLLRRWLRDHGPASCHGSIMQFAGSLDDAELAGALRAFDASGFSGDAPGQWDGQELWRAFSTWLKHRGGAKPGPSTGPDLYSAGS